MKRERGRGEKEQERERESVCVCVVSLTSSDGFFKPIHMLSDFCTILQLRPELLKLARLQQTMQRDNLLYATIPLLYHSQSRN